MLPGPSGKPIIRNELETESKKRVKSISENPSLWKMILYIGDIRAWNSLDSLMDYRHRR